MSSHERLIDAGVWLRAGMVLIKTGVIIGVLGVVSLPIVFLLTRTWKVAYAVAAGSVLVMLVFMWVSFLMEPLRMNGIPLLER